MKLKTIVIDDEPLALGLIESYVSKTPFLDHIASFYSGVEAVHSGQLGDADLIFLDIQMPTLNGLELSRMVNPRTRIIFTTAFDQYALDGFRVNALDYLLKPISYLDFLTSANKALSWFELVDRAEGDGGEQEIESIYVKSDYKLLRIELNRLVYVEGLKDYVKFYVEGEQHPILSLMSIKRAVELLPERDFIRVNRSFIVRKDKIGVIERSRIVIGNVYIPIGDAYKDALQGYLKMRSL
ncbi:MAG: LytTR family DNA-binding domain-containing protein [Rikenellaceae bacterium]